MTKTFKILSAISFIALAIVLTFVDVWALTDLDFTVGGNIIYTAPASEVKDVSEYPTLQFYVTDSTAKTVSVQANRSNLPTGELVIPSKVLSGGEEYTVTSIDYVSSGTLLQSTSQNFDKEIQLPEMRAPSLPPAANFAFNGCTGLTSVTIPDSVTSIESYAFEGCTGLTSVELGSCVTSIGDGMFRKCTSLISITIPDSVTSIGLQAFYNCEGLTSITIPASVTSITENPFSGCSGLETIVVESGNTKYNSNNNCNAIIETATNTLITGCKNTAIPSTVTSIGDYAFRDCTGLTSIIIPDKVTSIGGYAFNGCISLVKVEVKATTPPTLSGAIFFNCPLTTGILVPSASVSAYKSATYWKNYNIVDGGF